MVTRRRAATAAWLLLLVVAGCAAPTLDERGAADVAVAAFARAGLDARDVDGVTLQQVDLAAAGDTPRSGDVWLMTLDVDGDAWTVGVDPARGAVVRTFEPVGSQLTDEQVEAIASYADNPAADRASRTRRRIALAVGVVIVAAGYVVLRTLARRAAENPSPTIVDPDD